MQSFPPRDRDEAVEALLEKIDSQESAELLWRKSPVLRAAFESERTLWQFVKNDRRGGVNIVGR